MELPKKSLGADAAAVETARSAEAVPQLSHATPGPWRWDYEELIGANGEKVIYETDNGACGDPECCGDYREYMRARTEDKPLIAAAPELLEALKAMSLEFNLAIFNRQISSGTHNSNIADRALAAIAKAEGRS